ncbi:MAG: hypothetical protein V2A65_00695 [Candidatus Omnitrophota bacterium]
MIRINLLPPDLRPRKRKTRTRITVKTNLLLPVLETLIIAVLLFFFVKFRVEYRKEAAVLERLNQTIQAICPELQEIKKTQEEIARIKKDIAPMEDLEKNRVPWPEILNQIKHDLPRTIWLTKLVLEQKVVKKAPSQVPSTPGKKVEPKQPATEIASKFLINGSAFSESRGDSLNALASFVDNLNRNSLFTKQFQAIKIVSCTGKKAPDFEMIEFQLELPLQK